MAQADTLVALVKAAGRGDSSSVIKITEGLITDERSKGHEIVAQRLERAVRGFYAGESGSFQASAGPSAALSPVMPETLLPADEKNPQRSLKSVQLGDLNSKEIQALIEEQQRSDLLHVYSLSHRHTLLLAGPPGNGKTSLAEALACELMVPLSTVRYDELFSSYLGETAARLKVLFDHVRTRRCVLFFDEFETVGKERGDPHESGEIKRIVSSLLLQLDALPDYVVAAVASNHPELLDWAVWRRFQLCLILPKPDHAQLAAFIASVCERCRIKVSLGAETIALKLKGSSYAEAEEFCLGVARRAVLKNCTEHADDTVLAELGQRAKRLAPASVMENPAGGVMNRAYTPFFITGRKIHKAPVSKRNGFFPATAPRDKDAHTQKVAEMLTMVQEHFTALHGRISADRLALPSEAVLVIEIAGSLDDFAAAAKAAGLEVLGESDLELDGGYGEFTSGGRPQTQGRLYLAMSSEASFKRVLGLWDKWIKGEKFDRGLGQWKKLFTQLKELRLWNYRDSLLETGMKAVFEHKLQKEPDAPIRFQLELFWHEDQARRNDDEGRVKSIISSMKGWVLASIQIEEICFQGIKAELPATAVEIM